MQRKLHFITAQITLMLFLTTYTIQAQERNFSKISFGFQLQQVQNDFGFGIHFLSPTVGDFRLKSSYNFNWFIHENNDQVSVWTEYSSFNFGTRYQTLVSKNINLYVEGGPQILLNKTSVSSENINFGGYGLFGFEFFLSDESIGNTSYFIELGATGNNSRADKTVSKPKVGNGFITSVGMRF